MDISWILFLISLQFTVKCVCYSLSLTRNEDLDNRLDIDDERDRDIQDSRERSDWRRPDTNQEDNENAQFKGWNYVDTSKEWSPHKKTISLQVLDDPPYYHGGRPSWPHDEYLYGSFYGPHNRNGTGNNSSRPSDLVGSAYEWQRLPYRYSSYYGYPYPNQQTPTVTDTNSNNKLETTDAQGTSISDKRHHPYVYGGNSWYSPYFGNEYRGGGGRRRFRLQIHPGLIAAPLAGIAAYKAASAFNPLLVELGIIDKGQGHGHGWGGGGGYPPPYPAYPSYPPPIQPIVPPPTYIPSYRPPLGPIGGSHSYDSQTPYPILIPSRQPETEKSSWWNPFSVLTPRS